MLYEVITIAGVLAGSVAERVGLRAHQVVVRVGDVAVADSLDVPTLAASGGIADGDVVEYYISASDLAGNVRTWPAPAIVITSYSIHYTKLYDAAGRRKSSESTAAAAGVSTVVPSGQLQPNF